MRPYLYANFYKVIDGYLGNLGRFGEKNREGMWKIYIKKLGELFSKLCQGNREREREGEGERERGRVSYFCMDNLIEHFINNTFCSFKNSYTNFFLPGFESVMTYNTLNTSS